MNEQGEVFSLAPINAIESVSRAEIDQQISTAKRYPRKLTEVKQEMVEMATLDEETAASCFYSLPRGGKNIQGPSIRLAEIALSCYGNIRAGTRIIETVVDGSSPYVAIQAVCHDLQKNIAVMIEKRRRIVGKKSKGGIIDEDDINLAANAGSAIAFRDAMFKVVPGILLRPVYEAAKKVAIGDAKTLSDRRIRAIEAFQKMGVPAERVLASIGHSKIDEVTLEDLENLIGTFTAIKEGSTTIENAFPPVVKEQRKVEKPDFTPPSEERKKYEEQSRQAQAAPPMEQETAMPTEPKEKTKVSKKVAEAPQTHLFNRLSQEQINQTEFIEGLKLIKWPGVAADAELVHELSDDICNTILSTGLSQIRNEISAAKDWDKVTQ
jgi:hypothetical protein